MRKVAFIGCGNMGSALAQGLASTSTVTLFDRNLEKSQALSKQLGGSTAKTLEDAVKGVDYVVLAIKPKDFSAIVAKLAPQLALEPKAIVISLLTGISLSDLREKFPVTTFVRAMPNLAVSCGKGVTGFVEDPNLSSSVCQEITTLFAPTGMAVWVPENKIDALMALTACAPAFVAHLIEAFTEGGIHMGFSPQQALPLVMRVFEGTIAMMEEQNLHPAVLRWKVAAPGGTTIEGLKVLEEYSVHYAIMQALDASMQKSRKMSSS